MESWVKFWNVRNVPISLASGEADDIEAMAKQEY